MSNMITVLVRDEGGDVQLTLRQLQHEVRGAIGAIDEGRHHDAMEVLEMVSSALGTAQEELRTIAMWDPAAHPDETYGLSIIEAIDIVQRVAGGDYEVLEDDDAEAN